MRLVSWIVCATIAFVCIIWLPPVCAIVAVFALSCGTFIEFANGLRKSGLGNPHQGIGLLSCAMIYGALWLEESKRIYFGAAPLISIMLILFLWSVLSGSRGRQPEIYRRAVATLISVMYGPLLLSSIARLMYCHNGAFTGSWADSARLLTLFVQITVWTTDTLASVFGKKFGKRPLTPISPKKTIEGTVGGFAGALVAAALVAWWWHVDLVAGIVIGLLGGVLTQLGDLIASAFKREFGIKDFGTAIPGHGGLIDRLDGNMVTSTVVYYLLPALCSRW